MTRLHKLLVVEIKQKIAKRMTKGASRDKLDEYVEIFRESLNESSQRFTKRLPVKNNSDQSKKGPKRRSTTNRLVITQDDLDQLNEYIAKLKEPGGLTTLLEPDSQALAIYNQFK